MNNFQLQQGAENARDILNDLIDEIDGLEQSILQHEVKAEELDNIIEDQNIRLQDLQEQLDTAELDLESAREEIEELKLQLNDDRN